MRTSSRAEQRRRDRDMRRASANRRIGHDLAYWIMYGPAIGWGCALLLLVSLAAVAWVKVDHATIAGCVGGAGVLLLAAYAAWNLTAGSLSGRQMAAARGTGTGGHWHLIGAAGALLVIAAVLIFRGAA